MKQTSYTLKPIIDFDAEQSIIGWQLDHSVLGPKGMAFLKLYDAILFIRSNAVTLL